MEQVTELPQRNGRGLYEWNRKTPTGRKNLRRLKALVDSRDADTHYDRCRIAGHIVKLAWRRVGNLYLEAQKLNDETPIDRAWRVFTSALPQR